MSKEDVLDIAHVGFLEMIKALIGQSGAPSTKGTLIRIALAAADKVDNVDYPSIEDFLTAVENVETNISRIEGPAVHIGDGVFGLPKCPFADSIVNYKDVFKGMPEGFAEVTNEFNREGIVTDKFRVGSGAGVSPFCAIINPSAVPLATGSPLGGRRPSSTNSAVRVRGEQRASLKSGSTSLDTVKSSSPRSSTIICAVIASRWKNKRRGSTRRLRR